jgi:arsenite methyltransferase
MGVGTSIRRRGSYGIDAPYVPAVFGALGLFFVALAVLNATQGAPVGVITTALIAILFFGCMTSYLYTTKVGKFVVWSQILDGLSLGGAEQVLDMGCGRGAVLLLAARRLDTGGAHGVDLWRAQDQSGNATETTQSNAEIEGLADRVTLHTADMTALPFEDASFDMVVSSLAIHNIKKRSGRQQAICEGLRVLRPGGRLTIADFRHVKDYAEALRAAEAADIHVRGLGWRFWYGGPWAATKLVTATKPSPGSVGG